MSTSDNNLLNFLQKQSLFNGSPAKNVNRKMSSRSREKRSEQLWQANTHNIPLNTPNFTPAQNFNTSAAFNATQNNNFTTGASFNAGQNLSFQANIQDNNINGYYNPNQLSSLSQNTPFGQVDLKV